MARHLSAHRSATRAVISARAAPLDFEAQGAVRKAISIVKKRASGHEETIRELKVTSQGLQVSEPLREFRGIFTGVPEEVGALLRKDGDGDRKP